MAASMKLLNYTKYIASRFKKFQLFKSKHLVKVKRGSPFLVSALVTQLSCEDKVRIEEPNPSTLSREYLIKSSSVVTAENAIILLTQAALALQEAEKEYKEALQAVAFLIEFKLSVLGDPQEEARIWDLILQGRDLVSTSKKKRDNLELLYKSTWNLVNISAEVLYMTGAEMVGVGANERLVHLDKVLQDERITRERAEETLQATEIKSINVEGKYAEEHSDELDEQLKVLAAQQIEASKSAEDNTNPDQTDKHSARTSEDNTDTGMGLFDEIKFDD